MVADWLPPSTSVPLPPVTCSQGLPLSVVAVAAIVPAPPQFVMVTVAGKSCPIITVDRFTWMQADGAVVGVGVVDAFGVAVGPDVVVAVGVLVEVTAGVLVGVAVGVPVGVPVGVVVGVLVGVQAGL